MKRDQLLSQLKQTKAILVTLVVTGKLPDGRKLSDLSTNKLEIVVTTTDEFFKSVQSALRHLREAAS